MNKPEILSDEQVVEWLTTNRGEETLKSYCCGENPVNSLIVEHYGREAQRDADAAYYEPLLKGLRKKLWLKHSCTGKYGDDGEMQCGAVLPPIDFLRDEWETLLDKISVHENYVRLDTANTAIEQARREVIEEIEVQGELLSFCERPMTLTIAFTDWQSLKAKYRE